MPRATKDIADWAGDTRRRMPRSRADSSPGFFALIRRVMTASSSVPATTAPSRTRLLLPLRTLLLLQRHFSEQAELVQRPPGAQHHRTLGRVRDHHRQPRLLAEEDVEVAELRPAAREHDATV